jgi:hypothetical protein
MKRHDIDIVSLVSGLLFAGLAAVFALRSLDAFSLDIRVVPAIVLVGLGVAGIAAAIATPGASESPAPPADE